MISSRVTGRGDESETKKARPRIVRRLIPVCQGIAIHKSRRSSVHEKKKTIISDSEGTKREKERGRDRGELDESVVGRSR